MKNVTIGLVALAVSAGSASGVVITDNSVADRPTLTTGFSDLNLSAYAANAGFSGLSGANSNTYSVNFNNGINYSGTLTAEVFGDQGSTGPGLNEVIIVYTFTANGFDGSSNLTAVDSFTLGVDTGFEIDYDYLTGAAPHTSTTHGTVLAESTPGQAAPFVEVFDNVSNNDTFAFNFNDPSGSLPAADGLGATDGTESYTWYVRGDASVKIGLVDVTITNLGAITTQTLSFINNPNQPDLDVPAPGAVALAGAAFGAMGLRRRRK